MKEKILLIICIIFTCNAHAQSGNWVWLKGDSAINSKGNYGTIGVSSPANEPPARYQAAYWKDKNGNFWIFGGVDGLNDLWKYNPISNEWTWVHGPKLSTNMSGVYGTMGVPSVLNNPPALGYGANCWTDESGDFWLFAGGNQSNGLLSEVLWKYHIATNEWTWIKGDYTLEKDPYYGLIGIPSSLNSPGSRMESKSSWFFDNKLWLFGGSNLKGCKNDLWSYDITSNNWLWESGTSLNDDLGNFGTKGVFAPTNVPPSRMSYTRWQDVNNNFYLFAGGNLRGYLYNDVWKFSHILRQWTWISGNKIGDDKGTTNAFCIPDYRNIPTSCFENMAIQSDGLCNRAYWTFGGFLSKDSDDTLSNELWLFNIDNLEWTKIKGGIGSPTSFSYGTKGTSISGNLIPGRGGSAAWTDKTGVLYVFGGLGITSGRGHFNDLWKFIPDTTCFKTGLVSSTELIAPFDSLLCGGDTIKMSLPLNCKIDVNPSSGMNINASTNQIEFFGPGTIKYTIIATALDPGDPCFKSDTITFTIKGLPEATPDFSISPNYAYINNPTFNFLNKSTNALRYEWFYKGTLISKDIDIVYDFPRIGEHCLTLVSINNCGKRDSVTKCCYVIDTTKVTTNLDTTICLGDTIQLKTPLGVKFFINPDLDCTMDSIGQTVRFYPKVSTIYKLIAQNTVPVSFGLKNDTININIDVALEPVADFTFNPQRIYAEKPSTILVNLSKNAVRYEWYYNGQKISTEKDFNRTFADLGEYCFTLLAINDCGHKDTLTQCCNIYVKGKLAVPNAFTPNGDSRNDLFRAIVSSPIQKFSLLIFNRFGQEIFKSDNHNIGWDGRFNGQDQDAGVYFYFIKVKFDYPEATEEMYKGDINLIR